MDNTSTAGQPRSRKIVTPEGGELDARLIGCKGRSWSQELGAIQESLAARMEPEAAMGLPSDPGNGDAGTAVRQIPGGVSGGGITASIASSWTAGDGIAPAASVPSTKKSKTPFGSADFVAVVIDLTTLPLAAILSAPFTKQYCSVAAFPIGEQQAGACALAFELPSAEGDSARYALLQAGLQARYAGARPASGTLEEYRPVVGSQVEVLGGKLNPESVRQLMAFGQEAKDLSRNPDDAIRSRLKLQVNDLIVTEHGDQLTLGELHPDTTVFCPVHVDARATATALRLDDKRPMVACLHCMRGYTVRDATNDYDFAKFDRTIRELAVGEAKDRASAPATANAARQVQILRSRYLGQLPLAPGVWCVKSPKGSGKTEALANLIKDCKRYDNRQNVLLIGHRRTLLLAMARRLGLWCYILPSDVSIRTPKDKHEKEAQMRSGLVPLRKAELNEKRRLRIVAKLLAPPGSVPADGPSLQFGEPRYYYAVSLDSLTVLNPKSHRYDVVIIDEAEQVFGHLVGSTLKGKDGKRQEVFKLLQHYLRVAKTVILLDADLGMVTMDSLFAMNLKPDVPVSFILNEHGQGSDAMRLYESKEQLVQRLRSAVAAGQKCYVATNSKKKAIELEKSLAADWPDRRVMAVHSDNASSADVQEMLDDLPYHFEHKVDVLIASPALGTGVDITFKDIDGQPRTVVDHVFGLFMGSITTHMDIDQQLMRVRHPGLVHVWVDPVEQRFETDIGAINHQLAQTVGETRNLVGYEDDGTPILTPTDGLVSIWARVRAATRGSINRLRGLFAGLRTENGWRIDEVPRRDEDLKSGAEALKKGKELRLDEQENLVLTASVIDYKTAAKLEVRDKEGLALTVEQRAQLDRYRLEAFYAEPVSKDLIDFDDDGRMPRGVRLLEVVLAPDGFNSKQDRQEMEDKVWAADLRTLTVKARLLRDVLAAAGAYDVKRAELVEAAVFEQDSLALFVIELRKNRRQFESVFKIVPRKDADHKRVSQLAVVLGMVGLKLAAHETTDGGGKKVRKYRLDSQRLARLRQVLRQRALAREAMREAEEKKNEVEEGKKAKGAQPDGAAGAAAPPSAQTGSAKKDWKQRIKLPDLGDTFSV